MPSDPDAAAAEESYVPTGNPDAAGGKAEPTVLGKKSIWQRLRPIWWAQGVVGATGLIGLLQAWAIVPSDALRVLHFIGANWNLVVGWAIEWVDDFFQIRLPLSAGEVSMLAAFSTLLLPPALSAAKMPLDASYRSVRFVKGAMIVAIAALLASPFIARDMAEDTNAVVWGSLAGCVLLTVADLWPLRRPYASYLASRTVRINARRLAHGRQPMTIGAWRLKFRTFTVYWSHAIAITLLLGGACAVTWVSLAPLPIQIEWQEAAERPVSREFTLTDVLGVGAMALMSLFMFVSLIGRRLFFFASDHFKRLFIVFSALLTLEVAYLIPVGLQWVNSEIDKVESGLR